MMAVHANDVESNFQEFIRNVGRLVDECERRSEVQDISVIDYMLNRITSCHRSIQSLISAKERLTQILTGLQITDLDELQKEMNTLRLAWITKKEHFKNRELQVCFQRYTAKPVPTGTPGRPKVSINFEQIEELLSYSFNINMISKIIGVHRTTLWRRMKENGYDYSKKYTDINPESIDSLVTEIKLLHPYSGERTVTGIIRSRGLKIQRWKLRESIHRIDPINTALRWLRKNPRFVYSVPGPNSLWHNDGLHKLISWGFVVHSCIDGYSRMLTSIGCATNNRSETALKFFLVGVENYGLPCRVRGDYGSENNGIENYMLQNGCSQRAYIRGPSVHNQRIERLHYDTTHCALAHFIDLFIFIEDHEILDPSNPLDMFALHFTYLPRIQYSLNEFREGWNHHPMSTEHNRSPYQIWTTGMMDSRNENQLGVSNFLAGNVDRKEYGVDPSTEFYEHDLDQSCVDLNDIDLGEQHEQIKQILKAEIEPTTDDGNFGIEIYAAVKKRIRQLIK